MSAFSDTYSLISFLCSLRAERRELLASVKAHGHADDVDKVALKQLNAEIELTVERLAR